MVTYRTAGTSEVPARLSLHYLCVEIVRAQDHMQGWNAHCVWDKAEWWEAYLERLQAWHMAWVRHRRPWTLQLCPECGRVQEDPPHALHCCFACGREWLS